MRTQPYTASELRQQLRKLGIKDEQIFFDDSPDGRGIVPWGFIDEAGNFQFSSPLPTSIRQAEMCVPGGTQDNS